MINNRQRRLKGNAEFARGFSQFLKKEKKERVVKETKEFIKDDPNTDFVEIKTKPSKKRKKSK